MEMLLRSSLDFSFNIWASHLSQCSRNLCCLLNVTLDTLVLF